MELRDGWGTGKKARVDQEGKQLTLSVTESKIAHISHATELAFTAACPSVALSTTGGSKLWVVNESSSLFVLQRAVATWNGGSTNYNKPALVSFYFSSSAYAPTANATSFSPNNLNTSSGLSASGRLAGYYHDGVGDGMTVATNGSLAADGYIDKYEDISFEGSVLIAPGVAINMVMKAEGEAGKCAMFVSGYFADFLE